MAIFAVSLTCAVAHSADQLNLILIVADDLGYGDLGCYGSERNRTPHIDALAAAGARWTDFHSAGAMCTPTRAAMLTGRYQQRFGRRFDGPLSGQTDYETGLPHEALTIAELLAANGYVTGCFGKWHLGYQPPWLPPNQGFHSFRGLGSGDGDFHTHIDRSGREDWWRDNAIAMEKGYTTDLLTDYSIEFIEENRDRPFFLYLPHLAIHFPWQGPDDPPHRAEGTQYHDDKWGVIPNPSDVSPHVKAMVESLDRGVGRIMASLRECNLGKNTVVIFTSDNGGYLTYGDRFKNISSNGPLRDQKGSIYEGGHRVPMIVRWPGVVQPGEIAETGHSTDLFPTLAALAGVSTEGLELDGADLTPVYRERKPIPNRTLFWRMDDERAVRRGPWKLCVAGGATELYNLDTDLAERNNLADQMPARVRELSAAWTEWETDVNQSARRFEK